MFIGTKLSRGVERRALWSLRVLKTGRGHWSLARAWGCKLTVVLWAVKPGFIPSHHAPLGSWWKVCILIPPKKKLIILLYPRHGSFNFWVFSWGSMDPRIRTHAMHGVGWILIYENCPTATDEQGTQGRKCWNRRFILDTALCGNWANEVCCSFNLRKLNHLAQYAFSLIMRGLKEGPQTSQLFGPTSCFARFAVAKNDTSFS